MTDVDLTGGGSADDGFDGAFLREARVLGTLAGGAPELSDAPGDLWERIAAAMEETDPSEQMRLHSVDGDGGGAASSADAGPTPRVRRLRPRRDILLAVAAALFVVLVGAGVVLSQRDSGPSTVASAVLEPYEGAQVGTARGQVDLVDSDGQLRLRVDMHDLPAPAPGTFYEMWLMDPETGTPVSVASMKDSEPDVAAVLEVPAGTAPSRYDVVDVSVQREDEGPQHSGDSVLRGTLAT